MNRVLPFLGVALLALSAFGCGNDAYEKNDKTMGEMVAAMKDMEEAFKSVKDQDSAKAAAVKIEKVCDDMDAIAKKVETLPKITKSESDKLEAKYKGEMEAIGGRMKDVAVEAGKNSGGEESFMKALKRLESVGKNMETVGKRLSGS
jgi:hypothetical protein